MPSSSALSFGPVPAMVLDCRNRLGESILWDDRAGRLRWVNIHDGGLWSWDPMRDAAPALTILPQRIAAIGLRESGGLVAALEGCFVAIAPDGTVAEIAAIDPPVAEVRLNDKQVGPDGRFLCGGMHEGAPQQALAALYAPDGNGSARRLLSGVACANSICWSMDSRTMYFADMPTRRSDALDYRPEAGVLGSRRPFASLADQPGLPDGSIVDAEDCLWNAQWGGSKLVRYRPDGTVEREVPLPVTNPTCLAFGGPDLDILVVTSAWFGLADEERRREPHAGSLFALEPGVRGLPSCRYHG